jgi:hypothetical protein
VNDGLLDVEQWTEMLREVGFGSSPKSAEEFVRTRNGFALRRIGFAGFVKFLQSVAPRLGEGLTLAFLSG